MFVLELFPFFGALIVFLVVEGVDADADLIDLSSDNGIGSRFVVWFHGCGYIYEGNGCRIASLKLDEVRGIEGS